MKPATIKIDRLKKLLEVANEDFASQKEVASAFSALLASVKQSLSDLKREYTDSDRAISSDIRSLDSTLKDIRREMKTLSLADDNAATRITDAVSRLEREIAAVRTSIPDLPDLSYLEERIEDVKRLIPTLPRSLDGEDIRNFLEALNGEDRLDKKAIRGIEDLEEAIANAKKGDGTIHGSSGVNLTVGGAYKGFIRDLILTGAGVTTTITADGLLTVVISGSGTGGFTVETPSGSVNASNTVFTVTAEPQYMIADGISYFDGKGYAYAALTVTFDIPPSQYVRAII